MQFGSIRFTCPDKQTYEKFKQSKTYGMAQDLANMDEKNGAFGGTKITHNDDEYTTTVTIPGAREKGNEPVKRAAVEVSFLWPNFTECLKELDKISNVSTTIVATRKELARGDYDGLAIPTIVND